MTAPEGAPCPPDGGNQSRIRRRQDRSFSKQASLAATRMRLPGSRYKAAGRPPAKALRIQAACGPRHPWPKAGRRRPNPAIDHKCRGDQVSPRPSDQFNRRLGCSTRGDQIVDKEHAIAFLYRVGVDLNGVDAVFQAVVLADRACRKLALLAYRHEAAAEFVGDRPAQDEAPGLDARHVIDTGCQKRHHQSVDRCSQTGRIGDERGNVTELDSRLWVVGNCPDQRFDVHAHAHAPTVSHERRRSVCDARPDSLLGRVQ